MRCHLYVCFCSVARDDPVDPCDGVTCANNGICEDGGCVCEDGYTGEFCDEQVDVLALHILFVEVSAIANHSSWDQSNAPDLYLTITGPDINVRSETIWDIG